MPFVKTVIIIGICLLTSCGSQSGDTATTFEKSIPDTSKTWAGQVTKEDFYLTRNLEGKFCLPTLTSGNDKTEIRIWRLSGSYDPQSLNILRQSNSDEWSLRTIAFYRNKSDSIVTDNTRRIRASLLSTLRLDRYWSMPSQSDLEQGDKYGCMDGDNILMEMADTKTYKLKWYRCPDINKDKDSVFQLASELKSKLNALAENR